MTDILMSIRPPYVDMLLSGCKTVEIRKRAVRAPAGARIWIYATSPRRQVVASARLESVALEAPDEIWRTFGDRAGIDRQEYEAYIGDAELVAALTLAEITRLDTPLCSRSEAPTFRPSQSYAVLRDAGLLAALSAKCRRQGLGATRIGR
jgi:type I restriction enzyme S subunit